MPHIKSHKVDARVTAWSYAISKHRNNVTDPLYNWQNVKPYIRNHNKLNKGKWNQTPLNIQHISKLQTLLSFTVLLMALHFRRFQKGHTQQNDKTVYIITHQHVFRCCAFHCLCSSNQWLDTALTPLERQQPSCLLKKKKRRGISLSSTSLQKSLVKYSRKTTHAVEHSSVCCELLPPKWPLWCHFLLRLVATCLRGIAALWPLTGAGLAALLSIELVVTYAVLGNQVAPAEMIHTLFTCREKTQDQAHFSAKTQFQFFRNQGDVFKLTNQHSRI